MHKSYGQTSYGHRPQRQHSNGRTEASGATKPPVPSPYTHLEPKRIIGSGSFGKYFAPRFLVLLAKFWIAFLKIEKSIC